MEKTALQIPGQDGKWGSYISKYPSDSNLVPMNAFSAGTRNVITAKSGQAQKIQGGLLWNPNSSLGAVAQDQFEAIFESGTRILMFNVGGTIKGSSGNNLFSTIQSGYNATANFEFASYHNRVYGDNGIDTPQVFDVVTNYGGVSYSFTLEKTKAMGCQAPSSAPTVALIVDSTANQVPAGAHTYKITFVYYSGEEESNGGPASTPVTNDATHTSNALTAIPVGGYGVTARNIYRDNNDGNWLLLDTISNNTATTYTDKLLIGATPTPIPTDNGLPPTFKYIATWLDRAFVAGVSGNPGTLFWSNAGEPDVFSAANSIICRNDDIITALAVFNGLLFVFGQHSVGVILGTTDETFYYSPISTTVGCVDNRSIAVRSLVSVPMMIWLSALPNKGFYGTNGSAVQFLSEYIDDLTFDLSQVNFLARNNTQSSEADFAGDTSTPGIDLTSNPGAIQTINPKALFSNAIDWATGTLVNLAQVGDQLEMPTKFAPTLASGTLSGDAQSDGTDLTLPTESNFTGETVGSASLTPIALTAAIAIPIIPPVNGNFTGFQVHNIVMGNSDVQALHGGVATNSSGHPGSMLTSISVSTSIISGTATFSGMSVPLTGGTKYWIIIWGSRDINVHDGFIGEIAYGTSVFSGGNAISAPGTINTPTVDPTTLSYAPLINGTATSFGGNYSFTTTPLSDAGNWQAPDFDSLSDTNTGSGLTLAISGTYPSGCSSTVTVQGRALLTDPWTTTDTLSSPNGTTSLTGGAYRYWRISVLIATTNNFNTPTVSAPVLRFTAHGVWTSPAILNTTDIVTLAALTQSTSIPAGTTSTLLIRTSANAITWSSYSVVGSATPNKYSQLQLTLVTDTDNALTPVVSAVELDWTLSSTITSVAIDTAANPPAGWGPFEFEASGTGTVTVYLRTASTSGGLSGASYIAIANGDIPTNSVLEWAQWKIVFTATADNISVVDSVSLNWFIGSGHVVRCAATFFDKSYFCAVASKTSAINDLLIEFDLEGKWRIHDAFHMATLGTYFNDLYYASATAGNVLNAFKRDTENGTDIVFDLRTKAITYGDHIRLKIPRSMKVTGVGTGTTIHAYFSIDKGDTWVEMLNSSGSTGFTTPSTGAQFTEYFIPNYNGANQLSGRTLTYRITSADELPCAILSVEPSAYKRAGKALREIVGY